MNSVVANFNQELYTAKDRSCDVYRKCCSTSETSEFAPLSTVSFKNKEPSCRGSVQSKYHRNISAHISNSANNNCARRVKTNTPPTRLLHEDLITNERCMSTNIISTLIDDTSTSSKCDKVSNRGITPRHSFLPDESDQGSNTVNYNSNEVNSSALLAISNNEGLGIHKSTINAETKIAHAKTTHLSSDDSDDRKSIENLNYNPSQSSKINISTPKCELIRNTSTRDIRKLGNSNQRCKYTRSNKLHNKAVTSPNPSNSHNCIYDNTYAINVQVPFGVKLINSPRPSQPRHYKLSTATPCSPLEKQKLDTGLDRSRTQLISEGLLDASNQLSGQESRLTSRSRFQATVASANEPVCSLGPSLDQLTQTGESIGPDLEHIRLVQCLQSFRQADSSGESLNEPIITETTPYEDSRPVSRIKSAPSRMLRRTRVSAKVKLQENITNRCKSANMTRTSIRVPTPRNELTIDLSPLKPEVSRHEVSPRIQSARERTSAPNKEEKSPRRCTTARSNPAPTQTRVLNNRPTGHSVRQSILTPTHRSGRRDCDQKQTCKMWSTSWYDNVNVSTPKVSTSEQPNMDPPQGTDMEAHCVSPDRLQRTCCDVVGECVNCSLHRQRSGSGSRVRDSKNRKVSHAEVLSRQSSRETFCAMRISQAIPSMPHSEVMRRLKADEFDRCTMETSLQRRKNYETDRLQRDKIENLNNLAKAEYEAMQIPRKHQAKKSKTNKKSDSSTKDVVEVVKDPSDPMYIAYYVPPLIARKMQNIEPDFFADGTGTEATSYYLPDRITDELGVQYDCD